MGVWPTLPYGLAVLHCYARIIVDSTFWGEYIPKKENKHQFHVHYNTNMHLNTHM